MWYPSFFNKFLFPRISCLFVTTNVSNLLEAKTTWCAKFSLVQKDNLQQPVKLGKTTEISIRLLWYLGWIVWSSLIIEPGEPKVLYTKSSNYRFTWSAKLCSYHIKRCRHSTQYAFQDTFSGGQQSNNSQEESKLPKTARVTLVETIRPVCSQLTISTTLSSSISLVKMIPDSTRDSQRTLECNLLHEYC